MVTLIPVFNGVIQQENMQLVDARILHQFLEVGKKFASWITCRINEYEFIENQDFLSFSQNREKPKGGRPTVEYHITLDMAKELSMIERTEKGRQARKYFIDCEKRLHSDNIHAIDRLLEHSRFLLSFDSELRIHLKQVPFNLCMLDPDNPEELTRLINAWVPANLLPDLLKVGIDRLARKENHQVI